jgi:hypothetical protein
LIRFEAQDSVRALQLRVFSLAGQLLFDSSLTQSRILDWKLSDASGRFVAGGVYLYSVTLKDEFGNLTKKLGKLAILREKGVAAPLLNGITVGELVQPLSHPAGSKWRQLVGGIHADSYQVQRRPGSGQPFETFFLVEATGNAGIGTTSPSERLTVAGVIYSTTGGIKFPDGTVQTTAATGSGSGWTLTGNVGTTAGTNFVGTLDNVALEFKVMNERVLRLEPVSTNIYAFSPNVIGGFSGNSVTGGVVGATIGGGGFSLNFNKVTDHFGTIGGGNDNRAGNDAGTTDDSQHATVGGGIHNTASGGSATVGGGASNTASGSDATVGGGQSNTASGHKSTVSGGDSNTASGSWATVGGGDANTAAGDYSFVVGRRAKNTNAGHDGVFLFADSNNVDFSAAATNEFAVRASGGYRLFSNSGLTAGVTLAAGASAWAAVSDRNLKEHFKILDGRSILQRLSQIPITEWNYKAQADAIRHIGPMAQDFYAAFGLGEDNLHISTIDADGIALVSIQALYELSLEKDKQIAQLTKEIEILKQKAHEAGELKARLEALEKLVKELLKQK